MALTESNRVPLATLLLLLSVGLAACSTSGAAPSMLGPSVAMTEHYGALPDEKFPIAAANVSRIDERYLRQFVQYRTDEQPGTIVIDTDNRFLYLVQDEGMAIRYGIGVGEQGLEFTGSAIVGYKREWPRWTPTVDMIRRKPELYERWRGGMEGGPNNPLGARALYLFKDGKDTLFRIHGTTEAHTIGKAVSSGCIRILNQDAIDLYRRAPAGSKVVVFERPVA